MKTTFMSIVLGIGVLLGSGLPGTAAAVKCGTCAGACKGKNACSTTTCWDTDCFKMTCKQYTMQEGGSCKTAAPGEYEFSPLPRQEDPSTSREERPVPFIFQGAGCS